MRRAGANRLPVLWSLEPPGSEVLLKVRQQANGGSANRGISNPDGSTGSSIATVHALGRAPPTHYHVL